MTRLRSQSIAAMIVVVGSLLIGSGRAAVAENWPGWRKDGSGISTEDGIPIEWSADRNIRWKTPIEGQGHSSPIVWDDQVLITTVRPTVEPHRLAPAILVVMSLLCGLALWRLTDGTFGDPLGNNPAVWSSESKRARLLRRISVWLLFVVIGYGTIVAVELAYDVLEKYPESLRNRLIDKTWYFTDAPGYEELDTPLSPFRAVTGKKVQGPFFAAPRIPLSCYYAGGIAILALLAVNTTIARRRQSAIGPGTGEQEDLAPQRLLRFRMQLLGLDIRFGIRAESPLRQIFRNVVDWIACIAAACFLITVHSAAMADLPFVPSGTTWFLTVAIGVVGLIAFNLMLPGRPMLRTAGVLITGALMFYLLAEAPDNEEFGIFSTALRAGLRPLVKGLLAVVAVGLLATWIAPLKPVRQLQAEDQTRRWSIALAALAILLSGGLYFTLANFLLPHSVFAREIVSVDRRTGDVRWTARCDSGETISKLHAANTMATPTPVTDGEHVYAHFGDAGLFCVDMSGDQKWKFDEPVQASHWGAASSPIVWQDLVVMTYDTDHQSITVGIDKERGVERWRAERTSEIQPSQLYDGYATPIIVERDGQPELVHLACQLLVGYEPATGKERWSLSHPGEQPVCTPVVFEDLIMILGGKYAPYLGAVRIDSTDGTPAPDVVWQATRNLSDMPSPVAYDGLLYMVTKDGIASCIDAQTGDYKWRRRIKGAYWSSVTAAAGKVYFCNANGMTTVIEAGPEYVELSLNDLDETVYASLAVSNGEIFIRTEEHLICIGDQTGQSSRRESVSSNVMIAQRETH